MNALVETLLTALALSASAACCLALLPQAPPRLRFAVAATGLAAWLVPWGALSVALPPASLPSFAAPVAAPLHAAAEWAVRPVGPQLDVGAALTIAFLTATLLGLALAARDCRALQRCTRRWRAASRPANHLRSLLPPSLAQTCADVRIVANSDVAAASGYRKPTIWIGDRHGGERLRLILVHEMCHVRARDPLWLLAIAVVRRLYWWNPLVAHLARQALLMLESTCDHRSAAHFDKPRYVGELAALVLAGGAPTPRMIATAHTGNLDVQRLRLLQTTLRVRPRDVAVVVAFGMCGATLAAANVVQLESAQRLEGSAATVSAALVLHTPAAGNTPSADDSSGSDAYTPQQYAGEFE